MRHFLRSFWLIMGVIFGGLPAAAAIPGADNPKCYTQKDFCRGKRDFAKRIFIDSYQQVGKHSPKWDADAGKFLDAYCDRFAYADLSGFVAEVPLKSRKELFEMGRALQAAGCDDPLVLTLYAVNIPDKAEVWKLMNETIPTMIERKYPAYIIAKASRTALGSRGPVAGFTQFKQLTKFNWDYTLASVTAKAPDSDLRYLLEEAEGFFESASNDQKVDFCTAMEKSKDTNPWLIDVLGGQFEIKAAWDARGGGWANNVKPEGWKQFGEHLSKARDYFARAHAMHPEFPEAATEMISVAMGAGQNLNEKERDWFDKAAKAQFDYDPAYGKYLWSIYPRWGGSHQAMFSFARECLDTGRYDTLVPMKLLSIVSEIDSDSANDLSTYSAPDIQAAVRKFLNQAAEKSTNKMARDYFASYHVSLAFLTKQWADAAAALDKAGDRLLPETFAMVNAWTPAAISQIRLMNSPNAKALEEAERRAEAGEFDQAIISYTNLAAKLPKNDPGQFFVTLRARSLEYQKAFLQGDWVSIDPSKAFLPWAVSFGDFKIDEEGAIVATADKQGYAVLLCHTNFWGAYEIKAKVDSPDAKNPSRPTIFVETNDHFYNSIGVDPAKSIVFGRASRTKAIEVKAKFGDENELHVTVPPPQGEFRSATVALNEQRAIPSLPLIEDESDAEHYVGIGIDTHTPGAVARFRDIKIRRIAAPRPPANAP